MSENTNKNNGRKRKRKVKPDNKVDYVGLSKDDIVKKLKFSVSDNDYLDKTEISEVIVRVFNKHGFNARTLENDGSVYVYVEVEPFIKEFEKLVGECFIDVK